MVEFLLTKQFFIIWTLYLLPVFVLTALGGVKEGSKIILLSFLMQFCWFFYLQNHEVTYGDKSVFISVIIAQIIIVIGVVLMKNKISSQQKVLESLNEELEDKNKWLEQIAYHDPLTGLPNRLAVEKQFTTILNEALANEKDVAVLYLNLERFHSVNDILGHATGDRLLKESAKKIQDCVKEEGIAVRHAGDEFIVFLFNVSTENCVKIAKRIFSEFEKPFMVNNEEIVISLHIGLAYNSHCVKDIETMIRFANQALYQAKKQESQKIAIFNGESFEKMDRRSYLEQGLKKAIENNELYLHYQPLVDLKNKNIVGVEALLRWEHPIYGNITPFEFIPVAEETGLILPIGNWVMEEACKQAKRWHDMGHRIYVAVNVSLRQTWHKEFVETVRILLEKTQLEPQYLKIEITESMMHNPTESKRILKELKQLGVSLSLDDFGTGYASLSMLGDLPFDFLKIDRSFIKDIPKNARSRAIVNTIIELGKSLNFVIIGEGLEDEKHLSYLKEHGCHIGQGYLFSKPIAPDKLENLLDQSTMEFGVA
jgi:diguanylate cyclase (GGDEF)-like protein